MKRVGIHFFMILMLLIMSLYLVSTIVLASSRMPSTAREIAVSTATPSSEVPEATPTIDRLAAPPTVENPNQADDGAQLFWLHCQPCHGDRGQGLTDEWRAQYPIEEQNCWTSRCHGNTPYENGFTLPDAVPAVVGEGSLARFETVGQLHTYIQVAMPFENPGGLEDEQYLAIAAFLARENGVWDGSLLDAESVHSIRLGPPVSGDSENGQGVPEQSSDQLQTPRSSDDSSLLSQGSNRVSNGIIWAIILILVIVVFLIGGFLVWRRQRQ
jgi:mono/diheme cytochrome c family protein